MPPFSDGSLISLEKEENLISELGSAIRIPYVHSQD